MTQAPRVLLVPKALLDKTVKTVLPVQLAQRAPLVLKVTQDHKALLAPLDLRGPKALLDKTVKTVLMARVSPSLALSLTKPHSPLV